MRCLSCNKQLNDTEATRKCLSTKTFIDLCDRCFGYIANQIPHIDGNDYSDTLEEIYEDGES